MIETRRPYNTIDRLLISYTKISLKKGIMQYKVVYINIILTFRSFFKIDYIYQNINNIWS
ncbi:hypothetical protein HYN48_08520 [Flavobacterium magnum]|uniref:Uncharacterized protein n=1 Tax=Flavobacterium magnum TaxID=2162713 RepID=A0A2S0RFW3_9FLAO|nr:hypothetical protein HYN48_08520 [Flavobacterium magnum]